VKNYSSLAGRAVRGEGRNRRGENQSGYAARGEKDNSRGSEPTLSWGVKKKPGGCQVKEEKNFRGNFSLGRGLRFLVAEERNREHKAKQIKADGMDG